MLMSAVSSKHTNARPGKQTETSEAVADSSETRTVTSRSLIDCTLHFCALLTSAFGRGATAFTQYRAERPALSSMSRTAFRRRDGFSSASQSLVEVRREVQ